MDYIEINCTIPPGESQPEVSGIVVALLAGLGFESFEETTNEVKAWIPAGNFDAVALSKLAKNYPSMIASIDTRHVQQENWNHVWESNFPMTEITGRCVVYAPFHKNVPEREYKICILPQMSFGTGHHETTSLMIELMLDLDIEGKKVLDMGCGTGILAILASMKKAGSIVAVDVDEWAYRNSIENCGRNGIADIEILQGDRILLENRSFDLVLANINRNILLTDIAAYTNCLPKGGLLQISGFYAADFPDIDAEAQRNGLKFVRQLEKKNWVATLYHRK